MTSRCSKHDVRPQVPRLMLVADRRAVGGRDLVETVAAAVSGGLDAVQVREKDLPDDELLRLVESVMRAVAGRATVLVNSRPEVAASAGAGLHLAGDAQIPDHRHWPLWGRSVHSKEEALRRSAEGYDYLLLGTVFPTSSKPGHPGAGLEFVEEIAKAVAPMPVIAIGGIDVTNAGEVLAAGAAGVAVRGAILGALDPAEAASAIRHVLGSGTAARNR